MPRSKSVPVKRSVDRFHHSNESLEEDLAREDSESEENDSEFAASAAVPRGTIELDEEHDTSVEWRKELEDSCNTDLCLRIDDKPTIPANADKWLYFGCKSASDVNCCPNVACMTPSSCHQLYLDASSMFTIVCGNCLSTVCSSNLHGQHPKLSTQLRSAVQSKYLRIVLATNQSGNINMHLYINHAATFISPILLNWILLNNCTRPQWYDNSILSKARSITSQFSAGDFLTEISDQYIRQDKWVSKSTLAELASMLQQSGVRTALRFYQLEGVQWMAQKLFRKCINSDTGHTNASNTEQQGAWLLLNDYHLSHHSTGSSSSNTTNDTCCVWYNTLTEQLYFGTLPPSLLVDDSTPTSDSLTHSVILADEMGVGKSLQILSLILAMNQMKNISTSTSVCASAVPSTSVIAGPTNSSTSMGTISSRDTDVELKVNASPTSSNRPCLCGNSSECKDKALRMLGWIQCSTCMTWMHAHCAGFNTLSSIENVGDKEYVCLSCSCLQLYAAPVVARTTLIVMPNTLIHQWKNEMLKHLKDVTFDDPHAESGLKVFIYPEEVGKSKHENFARLDPRTLAQYDIILISFKALQKGYHDSNVDYKSERILHSTYAIYPPPFLCIHYQLMVVDETQNIESTTTSQILSMCCKIASTYRICVSGTPFGSGRLSDLHSLCKFLRLEPFHSHSSAWNSIIESPALHITASSRIQWLYRLFEQVTLRRTKRMVQEQLGLPEHTVVTKPLQFSTFERALYEEKLLQYRTSLLSTMRNIPHYATNTTTSNNTHTSISNSTLVMDIADAKAKLELLRKGCCHPQVLDRTLAKTRNNSTSNTNNATSNSQSAGPRPLDEIMVIKVEQTRLLCEEHQRGLLFHLFALAATAACQAQCGILGIGNYPDFTDYTTASMSVIGTDCLNSKDSSGAVDITAFLSLASDSTPFHHLLRSFLAYTLALKIVHTNRQPTTLIAMCKVGGDRLYINDTNVALYPGGRKLVPHAQDGLSVKWDLTDILNTSTSSYTSISNAPSQSTPVVWSTAHDNSGVTLANSTQSRAAVMLSTVSPAFAALQAQLMFANGRRLTNMKVDCDISSLYRKFYSQQLHLHNSNTTSNTTNINTSGITREVYEIVLFPASVDLQASVGATEAYMNVLSVSVPAPYISVPISGSTSSSSSSADGLNITDEDVANSGVHASQRSKKYQLSVTSVHPQCLVLRAIHSTAGASISYTYMDIPNMKAFCQSPISREDGAKVTVSISLCANITLMEACFDTDALQELHVCHNINRLANIVPEQYKPVLNTCLSHILSHNLLSSHVPLTVKHVQPNKVLPYLVSEDSNNSVESNGASSSVITDTTSKGASDRDIILFGDECTSHAVTNKIKDSYVEQFLGSTAARETQIENEFLEAAASRRLLANMHLSELKDQITDIEGEIGAMLLGSDNQHTGTPAHATMNKKPHHPLTIPSAQRMWWNQLLLLLDQDVHFQASLQSCIDQGESAYRKLANFSSTHGLQYILGKEYDSMELTRSKAMKVLSTLSAQPSSHEILESSNCHLCRAYFQKTGPVCGHCKKQSVLMEYSGYLQCYRRQNKRIITTNSTAVAQSPSKKAKIANKNKNKNNLHILGGRDDQFDTNDEVNFEVRMMDEGVVDGVLLMVFRQLKAHAGKNVYTNPYDDDNDNDTNDGTAVLFKDLCALEIKRQELLKTEYHSMISVWDRYSDLLKAYDELDQCKTRTSLNMNSIQNSNSNGKSSANNHTTSDKENTAQLHPYELTTSIQSAYVSALQSEAELQKCTNSLSFYKEQVKEIFAVQEDPAEELVNTYESNSTILSGTTEPTSTTNTNLPDSSNAANGSNNTAATLNAVKTNVIPASPVKVTPPTCLICREDLHTVTAHTPSKHHHPVTTKNNTSSVPMDTSAASLEVVLLPCAHRFHRECVTRWVRKHKHCPLCKAPASLAELVGVALHAPAVTAALVGANTAMITTSNKSSTSSAAVVHTVPTASLAPNANTTTLPNNNATNKVPSPGLITTNASRFRLKGKWGTKVDTLVCDLLDLCEDQDRLTEKAIVFSQWVEMIDIVGEALRANSIPHVKCINRNKDFTGTGSLQSFRSDSTVRVLLMPLALGAEGLDLIVASHVFLLEPLLNIHQELQAVNRISRLGQEKKTYVHKYVVQNTIEENIVVVQQRTYNTATTTSATNSGNISTSSTAIAKNQIKTTKHSSNGKHGDDDLLSQEDLIFILGLESMTLQGAAATSDDTGVINVDLAVGVGIHGTGVERTLPTIHEVEGDNESDSEDESNSDGGSMDVPTRLMDHLD